MSEAAQYVVITNRRYRFEYIVQQGEPEVQVSQSSVLTPTPIHGVVGL